MNKYIKLVIFFVLLSMRCSVSHAVITWSGSSEWDIEVFASPGMPGSSVCSISALAVSDWKNSGKNKVYVSAYRIIPGTSNTEKYIYEYFWNGSSWGHETTVIEVQGSFIGAFDIIREIGFYNIRGDNSRLYFTTISGAIYEYSIDSNNCWKMDTKIKEGAMSGIENFKVADGRGSGKLNLYAGDTNWFYEYEYSDTAGWQIKSKIPMSKGGAVGIVDIYFTEWKNRGKKVYLSFGSVDLISELEMEGNSWKETAQLGINNNAANLGSPTLFAADCGKGERLYVIKNKNIAECAYKTGKWVVENNGIHNYPGNIVSITYGRVSDSPNDPVCIYALVSKADTNDPYNKDNASEIHELTFRPDSRDWKVTCIVPLYEQGALNENSSSFLKSGAQIVHLYMANARNEEETGQSGSQTYKYKRLYIIDGFGTCWECSVPPRALRPADPDDPYNPNNPNHKVIINGSRRSAPSILGER